MQKFSPNAWEYGAEKITYLDTFHAVSQSVTRLTNQIFWISYKDHLLKQWTGGVL